MRQNHPTPIKWMGRTIEQEHILRYLDRENPLGEIVRISEAGSRALIVTDAYCFDHKFICKPDGTVVDLSEDR